MATKEEKEALKAEKIVEKTIKEPVGFTPEQLSEVNRLIAESVRSSARETGEAQSVYGQRDPKNIESVNVRRIFGKFVVGYKNLQTDPMRKDVPKYLRYGNDPYRKLDNVPFITLILSDGTNEEEKEVMLTDYYRDRDSYQAKVVDTVTKKDIQNHGLLGRTGNMAREVDDKGHLVIRSAVKAESVKVITRYMVELPGFDKPVEFNQDFLA